MYTTLTNIAFPLYYIQKWYIIHTVYKCATQILKVWHHIISNSYTKYIFQFHYIILSYHIHIRFAILSKTDNHFSITVKLILRDWSFKMGTFDLHFERPVFQNKSVLLYLQLLHGAMHKFLLASIFLLTWNLKHSANR